MFQVTLLLTAGLLSLYEAKVFYVTSNTSQPACSKSPCYTLDEYAKNTSLLLAGNIDISLTFLQDSEVHNLSHPLQINFDCHNRLNIFFEGQGPSNTRINVFPSGSIFVRCVSHFRLHNIQIQSDIKFTVLLIDSLSIQNCLVEPEINVSFNFIARPNVSIGRTNFKQRVSLYSLEDVVIRDSQFEDVLIIRNSKKVQILACNFTNSQSSELSGGVLIWQSNEVSIQNVNVSNTEHFSLALLSVVQGNITNCTIENNRIGVASINSNLHLYHSTITRNSYGVVVMPLQEFIGFQADELSVFLTNCTLSDNDVIGFVLVNTPSNTILTDCSFYNNRGTLIAVYQSTFELQGETIFRDNTAERGGALNLINSTVIFGSNSNTMFINNTVEEFGGAIYIFNLPISLFSEILIFAESLVIPGIGEGDMLVNPNDIYRQNCFYQTGNNSRIAFDGNTAILGGYDIFGANVYTQECSPLSDAKFDFKTEKPETYKVSSNPTRVCFCANNTPQCENKEYIVLNETKYPGQSLTVPVVLSGFDFGRVAGSVYTNVLGKDHTEVIDTENQHLQRVNLMECSDLNYTVLSNQTSDPVFLVLTTHEQSTQERDKDDEINVTIKSVFSSSCGPNETFPCTALLTTPVYIKVSLWPCPRGFTIINGSCKCDENIQTISSNCDNQDNIGVITREGTVWVGVDTRENNTEANNDTYYWHFNCPRDYCKDSETSIKLMSPDEQCNSNRAGILCGRCQNNYSLQLGGNKCMPDCSDGTVSLLIVFAFLGIVLVVFIKLLDFTVSSGTINGLIFYANVVWSNNDILFSLQDRQSIGYYIITLPIAWINLDFGIEACFSTNFDQLTKTGLQFVFPVYIWCIAGLIIVISHYSTRVTKLFGNNSVSVLATLFLLSYGKLLRNITNVFVFADINKFNDTTRKVWSLDGNIRYGNLEAPGHIVLMVFALLFLILFLLPFTLTLLLVPFLRAKSHLRPLHWINTLKPFFDTYYGPFKDKKQHQVWTGILLMFRVLILAVFASTSTDSPNANILVMTMLATSLLLYSASVGLLYKKWALSMLDMLYLFNLIFLGGATLFYLLLSQDKQQNYKLSPVVTVSVCIALTQIIGTMVFHVIKQVLSTGGIQGYLVKRREALKLADNKLPDERAVHTEAGEMGPTVQIVEMNRHVLDNYDSTVFRESLFETVH